MLNGQTADSTKLIETGVITGRIVSKTLLSPLQGATIQVLGTKIGAVSKADGLFTCKNVPFGITSISVKLVGYEELIVTDVEVSPARSTVLTIELLERAIQADETVITASSFQKDDASITSSTTLTSEEVRRAPGVQEDVIRAIALVPGIAVTAAGRNDLAVRGGAPFENLFIVDNLEVPNINHFGSQGSTGGPLSLINVDLVQNVSISTGGFGAKFGDRLSSVTNLTLRDGNSARISKEINLSATGFGIMADGPIGENTLFFASVRRSYLDLIFGLAGFGFIPEYWDFNVKVTHQLDSYNQLSFVGIGALDKVKFNNTEDNLYSNSRVVAPSQNQYFSGITWRNIFSNGYFKLTLGRWFSYYNTLQQDSLANPIFKTESSEGETSLRADVNWLPVRDWEFSFGAIAKLASNLQYDVVLPGYLRLDQSGNPEPLAVDTTFSAWKNALYGTATYSVTSWMKTVVGARLDYTNIVDNGLTLSPRLSILLATSSNTTISVSGGRYYQAPQYIWLVGSPTNSSTLSPLRADQAVFSFEWLVAPDLRVQIETYYKSYGNYPIRTFRPQAVLAPSGFDDVYADIPFGLEPLASNGIGRSFGIELLVQKKLSVDLPIYGLVSLTVNRTEFETAGGVTRTGSFDTPIISTTAVGWRPSGEWELSGKVRASQGLITTPYITTEERAAETGFPVGQLDFAFYNMGARIPFFYALDLRIDKRWFFSGVQLITYIDVQNVTGRKNVSGYKWDQQTMTVEAQQSIGILPSIGVNIQF